MEIKDSNKKVGVLIFILAFSLTGGCVIHEDHGNII